MSLEQSADDALPYASSGHHDRDTTIKLAVLQLAVPECKVYHLQSNSLALAVLCLLQPS